MLFYVFKFCDFRPWSPDLFSASTRALNLLVFSFPFISMRLCTCCNFFTIIRLCRLGSSQLGSRAEARSKQDSADV